MALIGMHEVSWGGGEAALLDGISFQIEKGERVGLLGRNGVGKSSLLRLLVGEIQPDQGEIRRRQGARVALLEQEVPQGCAGTVFEVVAQGLGATGQALAEYHHICRSLEQAPEKWLAARRDTLQHLLDSQNGWELQQSVESTLSRTGLDPRRAFDDLSAGMKRRTLFARALALSPDLLLLDEPTNHLDIESIVWMEDFLLRNIPTLLFVTHDRTFLSRITTRIMELDRGRLYSYACDYPTYLQRREANLEAEAQQQHVFDKKLSQEEAWIRQGIKARRTRNEGRVRALQNLRLLARERRAHIGQVKLETQAAQRSGKLVVQAEGVTYGYGSEPVIKDFSTTILRGDKIGIIGPNGAGKTTLLRLLLKAIEPHSGMVRHGTHLEVAYFDQLRAQLEEQKSVAQNISSDNDYIIFNDQKRHVIGYLQDFLFSPERSRTPVHVLSGGERNRLMLAKMFTQPANLLVMDEPTNDLDAETLELLEELLLGFEGTLLLVSHDRTFLNNVVTSTLVFEGQGRIIEYAGGYDDWLLQRPRTEPPAPAQAPAAKPPRPPRAAAARTKRRTFAQEREFQQLPSLIDALENEQQALQTAMANPSFYKQAKEQIVEDQKRLEDLSTRIAAAYERWEILESLTGS